jgi:hypothetical protein
MVCRVAPGGAWRPGIEGEKRLRRTGAGGVAGRAPN